MTTEHLGERIIEGTQDTAEDTASAIPIDRASEGAVCSIPIEPVEITHNKEYLSNKGFRGRAFLMLNHFSTGEDMSSSENLPTEVLDAISYIGGDGFFVFDSGRVTAPGGLLLGGMFLFDGQGACLVKHDGGLADETKPQYLAPSWPLSIAPNTTALEPSVLRNPDNYPYMLSAKGRRMTVCFDSVAVEATVLRNHCVDANEHTVVFRDGRGGSMQFKDVLEFSVIAHDADADGIRELYLINGLACGRWLRVIKVVPSP